MGNTDDLVNRLAKRLYEMGHSTKWADLPALDREAGKAFVRYWFDNEKQMVEMLGRLSQ